VWIDEAGIDNRLYRDYARAPGGKKVFAEISGKKSARVSVMGALMNGSFIAPFTFQGAVMLMFSMQGLRKCCPTYQKEASLLWIMQLFISQ
jgi:hypothetical protein